jgi:MoxR-like ATPase
MPRARPVLDRDKLLALQRVLRKLPANGDVVSYCVRIAQATRPGSGFPSTKWIRWGAGPRASQYLAVGARTWAALHGHEVPTRDDVRAVAETVLRHRIVLNFEAEASGLSAGQVVRQILEEVG